MSSNSPYPVVFNSWPGCYFDVVTDVLRQAGEGWPVGVAVFGAGVRVSGVPLEPLRIGLRSELQAARDSAFQHGCAARTHLNSAPMSESLTAWSDAVLRAEHAEHLLAELSVPATGGAPGAGVVIP